MNLTNAYVGYLWSLLFSRVYFYIQIVNFHMQNSNLAKRQTKPVDI